MSLRNSIFDGSHEKELFKHLNSVWGNVFNIYPQLPFTKIFDIKTLKVSRKERDFLLKTNIDYTICNNRDRPLMCIEFDGMCHGYSRDGRYIQIVPDPVRKKKLELKLKIAKEHSFPFYIISYNETTYISEQIYLAIIDSIIGQTMTSILFPKKVNEYLEGAKDFTGTMDKGEVHDYIQDLIINAEVDLELTWDPVSRKASEIEKLLILKGILKRYSYRFLSKPDLPEIKDICDVEGLKKRMKAWDNIEWQGCEVICETPMGKVMERVWVRNFEGAYVSPIIIAKNIAELITFYKVAVQSGVKP